MSADWNAFLRLQAARPEGLSSGLGRALDKFRSAGSGLNSLEARLSAFIEVELNASGVGSNDTLNACMTGATASTPAYASDVQPASSVKPQHIPNPQSSDPGPAMVQAARIKWELGPSFDPLPFFLMTQS